MGRRRTGPKPPEVVIDGAHHDQFVIGTNALTAEDAFTEVPYNKRICLFKTGIMGHGIKTYETHAQFGCDLP